MDSRSVPVSPEELAAAREILSRANQYGVSSKASKESAGSMNDSCKRLRDHAQPEADEWEPVTYEDGHGSSIMCERAIPKEIAGQMPVMPKAKAIDLPPGVADLQDWGSTICALPKVAGEKLSYRELVSDPKRAPYLKWICDHGKNRGGRFEDLAKYLQAVGFEQKTESTCYPGTTEAREKKK